MGTAALTVFRRQEKKYLLSEGERQYILSKLETYMCPDEYGEYTVCNVYFDTEHDDLIRRSLEKPVFKEKLRVRSYGVPTVCDPVFLEIKRKYKGVVYKRRATLPYGRLLTYLDTGQHPLEDSQIWNEIEYCMQLYKVQPKLFLAYDRIAFRGLDMPNLRVTFDSNIRYRQTRLSLSAGDDGERLLPQGKYIMEIKSDGAIPLWLCEILDAAQVYPTPFSKYGNVYQKQLQKVRGA